MWLEAHFTHPGFCIPAPISKIVMKNPERCTEKAQHSTCPWWEALHGNYYTSSRIIFTSCHGQGASPSPSTSSVHCSQAHQPIFDHPSILTVTLWHSFSSSFFFFFLTEPNILSLFYRTINNEANWRCVNCFRLAEVEPMFSEMLQQYFLTSSLSLSPNQIEIEDKKVEGRRKAKRQLKYKKILIWSESVVAWVSFTWNEEWSVF